MCNKTKQEILKREENFIFEQITSIQNSERNENNIDTENWKCLILEKPFFKGGDNYKRIVFWKCSDVLVIKNLYIRFNLMNEDFNVLLQKQNASLEDKENELKRQLEDNKKLGLCLWFCIFC